MARYGHQDPDKLSVHLCVMLRSNGVMTRRYGDGDADLIPIAETYTSWNLWRSRLDDGGHGAFYASRLDRILTDAETQQGLAETLAADSPAELEQLLAAQVETERTLTP